MIHPELWKLSTNKNFTICREVENSEQNVRRLISSHSFNKMVSVFLPDVQKIPAKVETIFQGPCHYYSSDLNLSEFINRTFVEAFIKRGRFYCVSVDRNLETENCVAVTPNGNLILSVNKETYQSIGGGLTGKLLNHSKRIPSKYFIKIDLKSKDILPGTKYHDNVKKALQNELLSNVHLKFQWIPEQADICSSSVAKYFAEKSCVLKLCRNSFNFHQEYALQLPEIEKISKDCGIEEIAEFVGYHTLSCDLEFDPLKESHLNDFNYADCGSARILTWKGFLACENICQLIAELKEFLDQNSSIPWTSIFVQGFENSPINFNENPHKVYINGDNCYLVLMKPNDSKIIFYEISNSNKMMK